MILPWRRFSALLLTLALSCFFSACQEKQSESYYFTHPNSLKKMLDQCPKPGKVTATSSETEARCHLAYHAALRMLRLSHDFMLSQTDFGQRIMRAQIRAVDLATQLAIAKKMHQPGVVLQKQLFAQQHQVDNLRAIVALFIRI